MNLEELKEKILSFTSMDEPYKSKAIKNAFSEHECQQSNKSDLEGGKGLDKFVNGEISEVEIFVDGINIAKIFQRMLDKEIEGMKDEIGGLREHFMTMFKAFDNKVNLSNSNIITDIEALKKQVAILKDRLAPVVGICEEKQERFILKRYHDFKFHIYDNKQEYFHDGLFSKNQAQETCRILNLMEASKNE